MVYFSSFTILIQIALLNLLLLVILTQFESLNKTQNSPENIFDRNVKIFKKAWLKFVSKKKEGDNINVISRLRLIEFLKFLGAPLGIDFKI